MCYSSSISKWEGSWQCSALEGAEEEANAVLEELLLKDEHTPVVYVLAALAL